MCYFDYERLLDTTREQKSNSPRRAKIDEFYSDRSRILYCSSFRRLQQKAQVFSLESNTDIRSRMTHSLEVSDLGRTLANNIGGRLAAQEKIKKEQIPEMVAVVENACLVHDIGNPPFGHFGEAAICNWARERLHKIGKKLKLSHFSDFSKRMKDFEEFDGNPQGFRVITKLHTERDRFGLNMTYASLLCALKYVRTTGEKGNSMVDRKPGYFQTEKELVDRMRNMVGLKEGTRYPLTYIVEAADDIAYCLSDISDGIEKGVLSIRSFLDNMK